MALLVQQFVAAPSSFCPTAMQHVPTNEALPAQQLAGLPWSPVPLAMQQVPAVHVAGAVQAWQVPLVPQAVWSPPGWQVVPSQQPPWQARSPAQDVPHVCVVVLHA